jgi:hypothetical protein
MPEDTDNAVLVDEQSPDGLVDTSEDVIEELESELETDEDQELEPLEEDDQELDGEADDEPQGSPEATRINNLEAQIARQNYQMQQMQTYLQQQAAGTQRPTSTAPVAGMQVPAEVDEWTPAQQTQWTLHQAGQMAAQTTRQAMASVNRVQSVTNEILQILVDQSPDKDLIIAALQKIQGPVQPLTLTQALQAERASKQTNRLTKAERTVAQQRKEQRKRGQKAKQAITRPQQAATSKGRGLSIKEALAAAAEELGRT